MCNIYVSSSSSTGGGLDLYFCLHASDKARPLLNPIMVRPTTPPSGPDKDTNNPISEINANKP